MKGTLCLAFPGTMESSESTIMRVSARFSVSICLECRKEYTRYFFPVQLFDVCDELLRSPENGFVNLHVL